MSTEKAIQHRKNIMILLIMMFFIVISSVIALSFSVFVMQLVLVMITIPLLTRKNGRTVMLYISIFITSICFIFIVYYANQASYGSPYYIGGSDDLKFENQATDIFYSNIYSPRKLLGTVLDRYHNSPLFPVYISLLIRFSNLFDGYNTFLPRIMNVYFLLWISILFEYFLKQYAKFSDKKTNICIAFFALNPNIQYINSHIFRDTFNLLQIFLIVFVFDKLISNRKYLRKIFYLVILFFLIYITFYTRKNSLVFAGAICLFTLVDKLKINKRYIVIIFILLFTTDFLNIIRLDYFIDKYSRYVLSIAGDGLSSYVFRQPLLPFGVILRFFYALITPFPNFFALFNEPNTIVLDIVIFLIYCGVLLQILFIPFILKRLLKFDWLTLSFFVCFLGVIITTFTFRHIMFYYPFMVAVGVDGYISSNKRKRKQTLFLSAIIIFLLALLYIVLKKFL